jgi:transcriptional regulator with XRE-family HTH domain
MEARAIPFSLPSKSSIDNEQFTFLWDSGMTVQKIAEKIGCSQPHASRIAKRLGLPLRKKSKKNIAAIAKVFIMYGIYYGEGFRRIYADRLFNFPSTKRRIYSIFYLRMKRLYDTDLFKFAENFQKFQKESHKESPKQFLSKKEQSRRLGVKKEGKYVFF